jgi:hypothetical protein
MTEPVLMTAEELGSYRLVYQSGHGDVFCDGERHIWRRGGFAMDVEEKWKRVQRRGACNCDLFANGSNPLACSRVSNS